MPARIVTRQWPVAALILAALAIATGLARQPDPRIPLGRPPIPTPGTAASAGQFLVEIEGAKQGKFKGEGTKDATKDKLLGVRFEYELKSPHDAATGAASGKRQHQPMVITKEWGAASPQLFQAAATNEVLKQVVLEFFRASSNGDGEVFYTIKLTNARVESIKQYSENSRFYEDVALGFQKIEVTHAPSKTKAEDDTSK